MWGLGFIAVGLAGLFGSLGMLLVLKNFKLVQFPNRSLTLQCLLYLPLALGAWSLGGSILLRETIHVDNFSERNLTIRLDGEPWLDSNRGTTQEIRLACGTYQLSFHDAKSGKELNQIQITVDSKGPFVLNSLGRQTYLRGMNLYTAFGISSEPPTEINAVWIRANVDDLFVNPPRQVEGQKVTSAASRTYLLRK